MRLALIRDGWEGPEEVTLSDLRDSLRKWWRYSILRRPVPAPLTLSEAQKIMNAYMVGVVRSLEQPPILRYEKTWHEQVAHAASDAASPASAKTRPSGGFSLGGIGSM